MRADSAVYQAAIFNYCKETNTVFAIGANQDAAVKTAIVTIPECEWKKFRDVEITETVRCMNKTNKAFRLIDVLGNRNCSSTSRPIAITPSQAIARMKTRLRR